MEQEKAVFLIDANSLITPYKDYYPFDLAPKFWQDIATKINNGSIALLDKVYDEVSAGGDSLSDWIANNGFAKLTHKNPDIISVYSEILSYIQSSELYTEKALMEWSDIRVADPWIIACAKVHSYDIVTFEKPTGVSKGSLSSHPKIPDVCKAFDVSYTNLFNMMRALSINVSQ